MFVLVLRARSKFCLQYTLTETNPGVSGLNGGSRSRNPLGVLNGSSPKSPDIHHPYPTRNGYIELLKSWWTPQGTEHSDWAQNSQKSTYLHLFLLYRTGCLETCTFLESTTFTSLMYTKWRFYNIVHVKTVKVLSTEIARVFHSLWQFCELNVWEGLRRQLLRSLQTAIVHPPLLRHYQYTVIITGTTWNYKISYKSQPLVLKVFRYFNTVFNIT